MGVTNLVGRAGHPTEGRAGTRGAGSAAILSLVVTMGQKSPKSHSFDLSLGICGVLQERFLYSTALIMGSHKLE